MNETDLEHYRHSLAHLLAAAVLQKYPDAKPTLGPAIDTGFYYDFEFSEPISDDDLKDIQKNMRKKIGSWKSFEGKKVTPEEAQELFKGNPYKLELINEIEEKNEDITLYTSGNGDFTDLCRGGHTDDLSQTDPKAFKLDKIAGAYWRGDENNTMLTRIYGLAFESKEKLDEYQKNREEAKKRDHRKIGKELDLFTFSELVGPGLPLWTPKGTLLRNILDSRVWSLRKKFGYEMVDIPHITKKDLFVKSGHWDKFSDELFRINTREGHEFAMKPMNCPFHTQIFARKLFSYREMPQRYANTTKVYRDEQTGELHGLSRVRSLTQDDAHVFCRESQFIEEALNIWEIVETFYKDSGFGELKVFLSLRDPKKPELYQGDDKVWIKSEKQLRELIEKKGVEFAEDIGGAAFYGPKIDFKSYDSLGREWQVATIQADRSMPESFDLTCINEKGKKERIIMIHAAIMGSIERFLSVLIEHNAGNFPLWMSPVQIKVLPIAEAHHEYANEVYNTLTENGFRVELDNSDEGFGKKVRQAKLDKVPYFIVIGDEDVKVNKVTLESRDSGQIGAISVDEVLDKLKEEGEMK